MVVYPGGENLDDLVVVVKATDPKDVRMVDFLQMPC
jgi:hypothetical protein